MCPFICCRLWTPETWRSSQWARMDRQRGLRWAPNTASRGLHWRSSCPLTSPGELTCLTSLTVVFSFKIQTNECVCCLDQSEGSMWSWRWPMRRLRLRRRCSGSNLSRLLGRNSPTCSASAKWAASPFFHRNSESSYLPELTWLVLNHKSGSVDGLWYWVINL